MMTWGETTWLWYLLLLIPAGGLLLLAWSMRIRALKRLMPVWHGGCIAPPSGKRFFLSSLILLTGMAFLCLTMADPRYGSQPSISANHGVNVIFVLDVSRSMLADDVAPTRLEHAKRGIRDIFKKLRPGDRTGIVVFSGGAALYCPPTSDQGAFEMFLDRATTNLLSRGGTDLGHAIETALASIQSSRAAHSVLIVFSDGGDHSEATITACAAARKQGVPVHCVGVGGSHKVPIRFRDEKGDTQYVRDQDGNMVTARLEEALLRSAAKEANGLYFTMDPQGLWREALIEKGVRTIREGELNAEQVTLQIRRFQIPLLIGFLLLWIESFISLRNKPEES